MKKFYLIVIVSIFTLSACGEAFNGQAVCAGPDCIEQDEICTNGIDDDGDGRVDCADLDCSDHWSCQTQSEICNNSIDDDGDGRIDCADSDCYSHWSCQTPSTENCTNGIDDDGDARIDCADSDCSSHSACQGAETECNDRMDNDGDGLIDCADPDCAGASNCIPENEHSNGCTNGIDDDSDGDVDCEDSDCFNHSACQGPSEICGNGLDDDEDGLPDCLDSDCANHSSCSGFGTAERICSNSLDDDGDGYSNCYDHDCAGSDACRASQVSGNDYIVLFPGAGTVAGGCDGTDGYGWTTTCTGLEVHGNYLKDGKWAVSYSSGTCSAANIDHIDFSGFQIMLVDSPHESGTPDLHCFVGCTEGTQANAAFAYNAAAVQEIADIFDDFREVPCTGLVAYRGVTPF